MVLLKDLRAEVSQIRETMQKSTAISPSSGEPEHLPTHYPPPASAPQPAYRFETPPRHYYSQHPPGAVQHYHRTPSPAHMRGTAQFQQRFAPQRYYVPRPQPRCYACAQTGEEFCQHCFRCGSSEHFRAGCRAERPVKPTRGSSLN